MKRFGKSLHFFTALVLVATFAAADLSAQLKESVPELSSRPGAAYTFFLNPAGFAFDGQWGTDTPGTNLGLENTAPTDTFTSAQQDTIRAIWAQTANQYWSFDVNVTTIDPAIAAGQAATDAQRQAYYDSQARMMHTIIGPPGNAGWQGTADGLANLGVIDSVAANSGDHTNFMFSQDVNNGSSVADGTYIGSIVSHEVGHTFGLQHQGDFNGGTLINEYGLGDDAAGAGSYVGIMGDASTKQRVTWRSGTTHNNFGNPVEQDDVAVLMINDGMSFVDSGIGHAFDTATDIPLSGDEVDTSGTLHRGIINPIANGGGFDPYNAIGVENYTSDFFKFMSDGINSISLTVNNGNDLLVAGVADNGAILRSQLEIYDENQILVGSGVEAADTLSVNYSGLLASGEYYAVISSFGGHEEVTASFDAAQYYDMGGYFLTGSGFAVNAIPEPASGAILLLIVCAGQLRRRR